MIAKLFRREKREASNVATTGNGVTMIPAALTTGVVQAAAALWERGFMAADTGELDPATLGLIGRTVFRTGEAVLLYRNGFHVAASYDIHGGVERRTWTYDLDLAAPGGTGTLKGVGADNVAHVRINVDPNAPWRGRGPLQVAKLTADLAAYIEQSLIDDQQTPVGQILAIPTTAQADTLADQIANLKGRIVLGESTAAGWDTGVSNPRGGAQEWKPTRIGPQPPSEQITLREQVAVTVLAAAGVPAGLILADTETGMRESWRRFLFSTVGPIGRQLSAELARVTGRASPVGFDNLFASDLQGRSRAYKQLLEAGMADADARRICGFDG